MIAMTNSSWKSELLVRPKTVGWRMCVNGSLDAFDMDRLLPYGGARVRRAQQMAKPQDRARVRQRGCPVVQPRELMNQRHVVQCRVHRRVAQGDPLLHEVNAEQGLQEKRWATFVAHRRMRRNQRHQCRPGHQTVHCVEQNAHALWLYRQVQSKVGLLHGSAPGYHFRPLQPHSEGTFEVPSSGAENRCPSSRRAPCAATSGPALPNTSMASTTWQMSAGSRSLIQDGFRREECKFSQKYSKYSSINNF